MGAPSLVLLDAAPRPVLNEGRIVAWRGVLDELSARYTLYTEEAADNVPVRFARFINYAQRRTTDTEARKERSKFVLSHLSA